jgi:hypothetical protein
MAMLSICGRGFGAFIHESPHEFLSNGDFNGDGQLDVIVLDRATGNARVGLQNAAGQLNWAAAVSTGVPHPTSLAVGRFAQSDRDAIAVTSTELNRVHVLDLSSNSPAPVILWTSHAAPSLLVGLDSPHGTAQSYASLVVGAPQYDDASDPGRTLLDLFGFLGDGIGSFQDQVVAENFLGSANAFQRYVSDATSVAAMRRTSSNDTFLVYSYTNTGALLALSNLPAGSEYVFGRFHGETLAQVLFYVPGQSNITTHALVDDGGAIGFGPAVVTEFSASVERVFYIDEQTNGLAVVRFGDGVISGLRPPSGGGPLSISYGFGVGANGNTITVALPLANGRIAFLSANSNLFTTAQAQVFTKSDSGYTQTSSSTLPQTTSNGTRANVWLFANEPFVNSQPVFVASLSGGDWITSLTGLPGAVNVVAEDDRGATSGLGNPASSSLGASPGNAAYGLPNQYHPAISLFSYSAPRQAEPVLATISPNPDHYANPVNISFTTSPAGEPVYYRVGTVGAFSQFAAPFTLGSNATVEFYATAAGGAQRSSTRSASYTFGNQDLGAPPVLSTNGTPGTNQPPGGSSETNFHFAAVGTVFYSRASGSTGSIWAIHLDGTRDRFITEGMRPRVSPDGRYLAFTRERFPAVFQGNLWVRDLLTGDEWRLLDQTNVIVGYDWEPAQTNLVFDQECVMRQTDVQGNVTAFPPPFDCNADAPVRNPIDGRWAFHNLNNSSLSRGVYLAPPDFSSRQRLPFTAFNNPRGLSWSPDGALLAYAAAPNNSVFTGKDLWVVEPDNAAQYQITAFTGADGFRHGALWTPSGTGLIGAGVVGGTNGIWIIELTPDRHACGVPPVRLPTTAGDPIDFVGTVFVPPPPPRLTIRRDGADVIVSWPRTPWTYVLQMGDEPSPGAIWMDLSMAYPLVGRNFEVRIPDVAFSPTTFFRLRR